MEFVERQELMATITQIKKHGNSHYIMIKRELCRKYNLKHNDFLLLEEVEIEKDAIGKTMTLRYGENAEVNAFIIKKNNLHL